MKVLAPSEPIIMESRIKKKAYVSDTPRSSMGARVHAIKKERSGSNRRGGGVSYGGMGGGGRGGIGKNGDAIKKLKERRAHDPLRQGSMSRKSPNCGVEHVSPNERSGNNGYGLNSSSTTTSSSSTSGGGGGGSATSPYSLHGSGLGAPQHRSPQSPLPRVSVAVDKHAVVDFGALKSEDVINPKRVWVGVASLRNDGNCALVFRVQALVSPATAGEAMWHRVQRGGYDINHRGEGGFGCVGSRNDILPPCSSSSPSSSAAVEAVAQQLPSLPQITPEYGVLACGGGKADVKFQIMHTDAAKIKALLASFVEQAISIPMTHAINPKQPYGASHCSTSPPAVGSKLISSSSSCCPVPGACLDKARTALRQWSDGRSCVLRYIV